MFRALSLLCLGILGWRKRKFVSLNREFAIPKVRYIERIYKTFVRVKRRETDFGSRNQDVRFIGGLQYREFTVLALMRFFLEISLKFIMSFRSYENFLHQF